MRACRGYAQRMDSRRPSRIILLPVVLLVVACVLLLAACGDGGPSKDAYLAGLRSVQGELAKANDASRQSGDASNPAERSAALTRAHDHIQKAADLATGLKPPSDARAAHRKLASSLGDYAELFDKLAKLKPGNPGESELYGQAGDIVKRLTDANRALAKAGYDVQAKR